MPLGTGRNGDWSFFRKGNGRPKHFLEQRTINMILIFFSLFCIWFLTLLSCFALMLFTLFSDSSLGECALAWATMGLHEMRYDMAFIRSGY